MSVACPFCEQNNQLPGMRQLRQLPLADRLAVSAKGNGNDLRRFLFSAGLLVAVLAALLGFALSYYADSLATELMVEEKIDYGNKFIDTLSPGHLWESWDQMATEGLPDWQESRDVRYNKQAGHLKSIAYGLLGLSGLGLLSLIGSFLVPERK